VTNGIAGFFTQGELEAKLFELFFQADCFRASGMQVKNKKVARCFLMIGMSLDQNEKN
jgi:hypothetical protein